jgi:septin family protein
MPYDIRFKTPFNCIVAGMSYSGKTTWVKNLLTLRDKIFTEQPTRIFLFYKVMQDIYVEMEADGLVHELVSVNDF